MSHTAIRIENLSKRYILGEVGYGTMYQTVQSKLAKLFGREDPNQQIGSSHKHTNEEFWALDNINCEIKQGDRVGIIGRNGAGKSTLLKILSKVTAPTKGIVKIKGRVASLLEVGTGFHPELTGRDNIYLNGTILGMTKREIDKKLDEIVAFAEIEQFIDTPVKRYSSGMYVRLAFAVAAHLDPEILIVDEVLAVGDAAFQKKALGKMEDVSKGGGRTVLFVSHNMGAVKNLCNKGFLLENGSIKYHGGIDNIIEKYISNQTNDMIRNEIIRQLASVKNKDILEIKSIEVKQKSNERTLFNCFDINIIFKYQVYKDTHNLFLVIYIFDVYGNHLVESFHNAYGDNPIVKKGNYESKFIIPKNLLNENKYLIRIEAGIFGGADFFKKPIEFFLDVTNDGKQNMVYSKRPRGGLLILPVKWENNRIKKTNLGD